MIELFLRFSFTSLLFYLLYWTIYILYITICFIFQLNLQLLQFLIQLSFELIYLSFNTVLNIKLYLISLLYKIICYLISNLYTYLDQILTNISFKSILSDILISMIITLITIIGICYNLIQYESKNQHFAYSKFLQNSFENQQFQQYNCSYYYRNYYSQQQNQYQTQNLRQESYQVKKQIEVKERKQKLVQELNENREMIKRLYQQKREIYQRKKNKQITNQVFKDTIKEYIESIEILSENGKELFLKLININNHSCRVDFHNFYKDEIKSLLDGLLGEILLYKNRNGYRSVKLKIIVGKGSHSKNGIPVIGPLTQEYLQFQLQKEVKITNGLIVVLV